MDNPVAVFAGITAVVVALLALILTPIRQVGHNLDVTKCRTFHEQSGYETKFVDYNFFDWDCLARTSSGKWVSTEKLRDID